ncbi:MAG: hypothetical protein JJ931_06025 [Henriciella sp.]|nr:hypothetical protein [Henriciella sp.]MBO6694955.1 hypothetical protein [Henriciella sp.]
MTIYKLDDDEMKRFVDVAEVAMGVHIAFSGERLVMIANMRIAIEMNEEAFEQIQRLRIRARESFVRVQDEYVQRLNEWIDGLPKLSNVDPLEEGQARSVFAVLRATNRFQLGSPPAPPNSIYGHLPFHLNSVPNEVFYRFESFPNSRRLTRQQIAKGTYAAPSSELFFTPTGFSAVGRFALPSLLPACWRYELKPQSGTKVYCGASVPLYGQSGGAVEVCFPDGATNDGPIANPVILPEL